MRVVRRPDGRVVLDRDGTLEGRGAYLCADRTCWDTAFKRSALQRALRASIPIDFRTHLEHGDVNAVRVATDHGAPATITGGTDGT